MSLDVPSARDTHNDPESSADVEPLILSYRGDGLTRRPCRADAQGPTLTLTRAALRDS